MKYLARRVTSSLAVLFLVLLVASKASASPITVSWTGNASFDDEAITFTPFTADTLVSIHDSNSKAFVHTHYQSQNVTWAMDILLNGSWTNLLSGVLIPFSEQQLADAGWTATFVQGQVSGLRFTSDPNNLAGNASYHGFGPETTFVFDTQLQPVPEPASVVLLGLGAMFGMCLIRRRLIA